MQVRAVVVGSLAPSQKDQDERAQKRPRLEEDEETHTAAVYDPTAHPEQCDLCASYIVTTPPILGKRAPASLQTP